MTRKELEQKLEELGYLNRYSLDGSICSDRRILYKTPSKLFSSEEEAYDYIYKDALRSYNVFQKALKQSIK